MSYETIEFIRKRDGDKAAVLYAKRQMEAYRKHSLHYGLRALINGGNILKRYRESKAYYLKHKDIAS